LTGVSRREKDKSGTEVDMVKVEAKELSMPDFLNSEPSVLSSFEAN
jgi:hypothetical protein